MKSKLLSLILLTLLFSCKSGKDSKNSMKKLESGNFQVVTVDGQKVKNDGVTLRIDLEEHRVSGMTGCNNYAADFIQNQKSINVGLAKVTKRYCQGKMKLERLFLRNLKQVKSYTFDGETLHLLTADGKSLIVAKKKEEE